MAEVRFTDRFERDLEEIGDFIALDKPRAAAQFIEAIRSHCSLLAAAPLIGQARPDIASAIRSFPHRRYHVLHRLFGRSRSGGNSAGLARTAASANPVRPRSFGMSYTIDDSPHAT